MIEFKSNFKFEIKNAKYSSSLTIVICNIKLFYHNSTFFQRAKNVMSFIKHSHFSFNSQKCDLNVSNQFTFFRNIFTLSLLQVKYSEIICPFIFYNKKIIILTINYLTNSFILKNFIIFKQKNVINNNLERP